MLVHSALQESPRMQQCSSQPFDQKSAPCHFLTQNRLVQAYSSNCKWLRHTVAAVTGTDALQNRDYSAQHQILLHCM